MQAHLLAIAILIVRMSQPAILRALHYQQVILRHIAPQIHTALQHLHQHLRVHTSLHLTLYPPARLHLLAQVTVHQTLSAIAHQPLLQQAIALPLLSLHTNQQRTALK